MNKSKYFIIPALVIALAGGSLLVATNIKAQDNSQYPSIIQKLVTKFGLKEDEVKKVFDENRTERQNQMQKKVEDNLTQLVKDGKLTEAQKQVILAKHNELKANKNSDMQNWKTKTPEEHKAAAEKQKTELEAWAKQNNIDLKYLGGFGMKGCFGKFGK